MLLTISSVGNSTIPILEKGKLKFEVQDLTREHMVSNEHRLGFE